MAVGLASTVLMAAAPTFWTVSSQADFLKGDVEDLSIDSDGRMFLGPSAAQVAETLGAIPVDADRRPERRRCGREPATKDRCSGLRRDGKVSTFFDSNELEVHALAPAPGGGLYVATSPDGRIYQVAADGSSKTSSSIPTTSTSGRWRWRPTAPSSPPPAKRARSIGSPRTARERSSTRPTRPTWSALAIDKQGNVIAGTESPGRIFRIDRQGKAFVLLDSPFKEIHTVKIGRRRRDLRDRLQRRPGR